MRPVADGVETWIANPHYFAFVLRHGKILEKPPMRWRGFVDTKSLRSKFTGLLTCSAAVAAFVCLRFSHSVLQGMLGTLGGVDADLPRLAVFALKLAGPGILAGIVAICLGAVVASEATLESEAKRLLVQVAVLLLLVILLAVSVAGFLISFHIPDVRID
jgi:hypothetical protein